MTYLRITAIYVMTEKIYKIKITLFVIFFEKNIFFVFACCLFLCFDIFIDYIPFTKEQMENVKKKKPGKPIPSFSLMILNGKRKRYDENLINLIPAFYS